MSESPEMDAAMLAFAGALSEVTNITKTNTADTGKYTYTYADLGDVLDECKRACRLHGLTLFQNPSGADGMLTVGLSLIHSNGQVLGFPPLTMVLPKEAQAFGSALTYARRYQLLTVFGIAPEDDDGQAATTAAQTQPGRRSEAERLIREQIGRFSDEQRGRFIADFKAQFGQALTDLPVPKHGDALTWTKAWSNTIANTVASDAADDEWKAQAQEAPA